MASAKIFVTELQHRAHGLWRINLIFDGKPIALNG